MCWGLLLFLGLTILNTTALQVVRRFSYRIFFIVHLLVAMAVPPIIIFHAKPASFFMAEAILVFIADLVSRKIDTVTAQATLESIPGTTLVKISATIPYSKVSRFRAHPGSHVYLSVPAAARGSAGSSSLSYLLFEFLFNPFTVAHVDAENNDLTLVVRHLSGPMISALARFSGGAGAPGVIKVPLNSKGLYGSSVTLPQLAGGDYDRVLLVAGGVGATFTVPLYRALLSDNPTAKVELVWAVRAPGTPHGLYCGRGERDHGRQERPDLSLPAISRDQRLWPRHATLVPAAMPM